MDGVEHDDALVTIAIIVSRVEAAVLVSLLEAAGVHAVAGGIHHASVEVNSVALGGHRIWVAAAQWSEASDILRETGADRDWHFCKGLRRAILRFLALWLGIWSGALALGVAAGALTLWGFAYLPFAAVVPVNPQGRGDFYLVSDPA